MRNLLPTGRKRICCIYPSNLRSNTMVKLSIQWTASDNRGRVQGTAQASGDQIGARVGVSVTVIVNVRVLVRVRVDNLMVLPLMWLCNG